MLLTRRYVLAAGLAAPFLARTRPLSADHALACRASLARLFPNTLGAARALGRLCHGGESGDALLEKLLAPDGRGRVAGASVAELRALIGARIRADYAHGRTRRIDGWVLSQTETRLFALLAA